MATHMRAIDCEGWTTYDFTLMRDASGSPILVADEIIREYISYIALCRESNQMGLSFTEWITAPFGGDTSSVLSTSA